MTLPSSYGLYPFLLDMTLGLVSLAIGRGTDEVTGGITVLTALCFLGAALFRLAVAWSEWNRALNGK